LLNGDATIALRLIRYHPANGAIVTSRRAELRTVRRRYRIAGVTTMTLWRLADHGLIAARQSQGLGLITGIPWWFGDSYALLGPYGAADKPAYVR
ncbi:MAG TPA: hypothetical protein VG963_10395, partial [Polyangiaceae bacterium]|nr:hypothetical protein [Polyangiaceae bacterium]